MSATAGFPAAIAASTSALPARPLWQLSQTLSLPGSLTVTPEGKVTDGTAMIDVKSVPGLLWQGAHSRAVEGSAPPCPTPHWTADRKARSPPGAEGQGGGAPPPGATRPQGSSGA